MNVRLVSAPAAAKAASWAWRSWPIVLTRALPRVAIIPMAVSLLGNTEDMRHAM